MFTEGEENGCGDYYERKEEGEEEMRLNGRWRGKEKENGKKATIAFKRKRKLKERMRMKKR